jgi:hypothetical protein
MYMKRVCSMTAFNWTQKTISNGPAPPSLAVFCYFPHMKMGEIWFRVGKNDFLYPKASRRDIHADILAPYSV